jgi:hypothetical protein
MTDFPPGPDDMARLQETLNEIRREAQERHERAIRVGYDIGAGRPQVVDGELQPIFQVWRVDLPPESAVIFTKIAEVMAYLEQVATLPHYCLQLQGNPRLVIASEGDRTVITDKHTGESFSMRSEDLKDKAELCVHADSPPTIGDWKAT